MSYSILEIFYFGILTPPRRGQNSSGTIQARESCGLEANRASCIRGWAMGSVPQMPDTLG